MKTLNLKDGFIPINKIVMVQVKLWDSGWKLEIIMDNCTCYVDQKNEQEAREAMKRIEVAINEEL